MKINRSSKKNNNVIESKPIAIYSKQNAIAVEFVCVKIHNLGMCIRNAQRQRKCVSNVLRYCVEKIGIRQSIKLNGQFCGVRIHFQMLFA